MILQVNISEINFFDVFLVLVLIWAIFKGYKRGPVVQSLSLLVIIVGIAASGLVSEELANFISGKWKGGINFLDGWIFAFMFSATLWLSNLVADKAEKSSSFNKKNILNIILGISASIIKYLYITSILFLFVSQSNLIPKKYERKSKFYKTVKNTAPATIKTINFLK